MVEVDGKLSSMYMNQGQVGQVGEQPCGVITIGIFIVQYIATDSHGPYLSPVIGVGLSEQRPESVSYLRLSVSTLA